MPKQGPVEPDKRRFGRAKKNPEALEKRAQGVNHRMEMSAYMDALGMPTKEIAKILGVHDKTVSHWRGTQDYMERVSYWRENSINHLEPIIDRLKVDAASMVDVAIKTLIDVMQNSTHADGRPNWAMRASAAREALNSSIVRVTIGADSAAAATINASQQTVTLVFNDAVPEGAGQDIIDAAGELAAIEVADVEDIADIEPVAVEIEDDTKEEQ